MYPRYRRLLLRCLAGSRRRLATNRQSDDNRPSGGPDRKGPGQRAPARARHHIPGHQRANRTSQRKRCTEQSIPQPVDALGAKDPGGLVFLRRDGVRDLRHERDVGEGQRDAQQGEKGRQEDFLGCGVLGDETQADDQGDGRDEAGQGRESGAVAVGEKANGGGDEAWDENAEEDEAC